MTSRRLPDFLGLGAQRAGTTWLDRELRAHPEIHLPERRKEVHFFDLHHERGAEWYEAFFAGAFRPDGSRRARAIGEITPRYLFEERAAERIRELLPDARLLAILRHPVDRAYSQWGLSVRDEDERRDFDRYLRESPDAFRRGLYAEQLERYLARFPRERLLVLVFEEAMADRAAALAAVHRFLGVAERAPLQSGEARGTNASYRARFPRALRLATSVGDALRRRGLDAPVNWAKRAGARRWFGSRGPLPPLEPRVRARWSDAYAEDVRALEALLDRPIDAWRGAARERP